MFGYHDSDKCNFDLWAPWSNSAIENRAFSGYAYEQSSLEDIADMAVEEYHKTGSSNFSIDAGRELNALEKAWLEILIKQKLERGY